ncbi:MAG TPA: gamma-glutamyltransferase, partial [Gemmatimonadaceae bacterium]|nr:gamma-glutamyltransferase [Gemmatimonadaceae bacterium]
WAEPDTLRGDARIPARGAGTPGMVAGLLEAHRRFGRLSRAQVMAPAIALARDGFVVTPLLSRTIRSARERLARDSAALQLFMPDGEALRPGERLVQPALASTLERIARDGRDGFYTGPVAEALSAEVRALGGLITVRDLATYPVATMRPLCAEWNGYTVLGAPPPVSGSAVIEILQMAEAAGITKADGFTDGPEAIVTLAGIQRAVTSDGGWWRGDPAVMAVPARGLSSEGYARERLEAVRSLMQAPDTVLRGDPWSHEMDAPEAACTRDPYPSATRRGRSGAAPSEANAGQSAATSGDGAPDAPDAPSYTSHLSVVDAEGNAVSLTTTVGVLFGSGVYTGGFFLNSSGNNFDDRTQGVNRYANSTIAPMILLEGDDVRLVIGAAGSAYIQPSTAQVTMRILAFGEDAGLAIAAPRIQTSAVRREVEVEPGFTSDVYAALVRAGYLPTSRVSDLAFGAVHGVHVRRDGRRIGIADPRRDGAAVAQ